MKLNEKIYYCRKKAGLSQVDLADLIGVSRQSVSKWETGEANPDVTKIPQLAKEFGVTADWLLSDEGPLESETPEANPAPLPNSAPSVTYPDWISNLPTHMVQMIKRYGWIYGVRMAIGGLIFAAFGGIARFMFHEMIFGFNTGMNSGFNTGFGMGFDAGFFSDFNQSSWRIASGFTGFIIFLGFLIAVGGAVLAVALKKWGEKEN